LPTPDELKEIISRYEEQIKGHIELEEELPSSEEFSREYLEFKKEATKPTMSLYEKLCNKAEKFIAIKPGIEQYRKLQEAIETAHLDITPTGATSFATLLIVFIILFAIFLTAFVYLVFGKLMLFLPALLILLALVLMKPISNLPFYFATRWRLAASNQMVLCVLYVVMYMRHTSNLEHAIKFAALHIDPPLSLDLRKIFWDVESGKFSTIKQALDNYLQTWRETHLEFVNAFHLIESSLLEPSEQRRLDLLDKALEVILQGTYEKMLHYAQELKNPITMIHMLGVILPILGLVIFPLVATFMGGLVKWYHLAFLYNIILPVLVFVFGYNLLTKRPTGYGESRYEIELLKKRKPYGIAVFIIFFFLILGLFPLLIHAIAPDADISLGNFGKFLDYRDSSGPYGFGALMFSLLIPLAFGLGIGIYYKIKTKGLIKIRNETKALENEFSASLFQLGNRLADGVPAELAFGDVAKTLAGTPTGNFFRLVSVNIRNLGMSLREAIFNEKVGAILSYPSALIQSSMEVLIESVKKGLKIAAQALTSISNYVSEIHRVNERLKDLLAEIVSSMKAQIGFMAPVIAAIVVGIGSMIVNIIANMARTFQQYAVNESAGAGFGGGFAGMLTLFKIEEMIPPYYFQLVVGVYVVEIIFVLTILANGIENGIDKLNEKYLLGKNLLRSTLMYVLLAGITIVIFNLLAWGILKGALAPGGILPS